MYLVTRLKTDLTTNVGRVDLTTNGMCGMLPVFADKQEALEYAESSIPRAEVQEIRIIAPHIEQKPTTQQPKE